MIIVAFLQNMWVRNPAKVQRMFDSDPTGRLRLKLIKYALFAGCVTGRRLRKGLGDTMCDQIIWEEANPIVDDNPKRYHPPDRDHIRKVLALHKPELVLCFTKAGESVIRELCSCKVIGLPHPAARGRQAIDALATLGVQLAGI